MRYMFLFLSIIIGLLFIGRTTPVQAQSTAPAEDTPVVRAVLFWLETCSHCHVVIEQVLPPLQQQYGDQLDIQLIEASSEEKSQLLLRAADMVGVPYEQIGGPFLVIGDRALIGSEQIPSELPGLIEQHLAQGGVGYPDVPGLSAVLPPTASDASEACAPDTACGDTTASGAEVPGSPAGSAPPEVVAPRSNGFALAIAIMGGMLAALVATGVVLARGLRSGRSVRRPVWLDRAIPILALIGLGVAGYLAYVETRAVEAVCGPIGDCNTVQSSPYAKLFGVLPVGVLGVGAYLVILAAWLWGHRQASGFARYAPLIVSGLALVGTLFSLYLTFLEPFVIGAVCAWCLASAVIITLLLLASLGPALQAYARLSPQRGG